MTSLDGSDVAVIIVNYNTAQLALNAVESVLSKTHTARNVEVHLVDNASPKGDGTILENAIKTRYIGNNVFLYCELVNHGFGRANNLVMRALAARPKPPRYIFLLNPDAWLESDAIAILTDFLDARPKVAVAGARIAKPGGLPVTAAFRYPDILSTFLSALSFGPASRLLSSWRVPLAPDIPTCRVDWVAGAACMMRFSAVRQVGFFDPEYFLYYEEVDLMRQIARHDGQIWYVAEAHVIHMEGVSTKVRSDDLQRRRKPAYWYESWRHYFQKNHGRRIALTAAAAWMLGAAMNRAISLVRGREPAVPQLFFHDFWALIFRPLLGLKALPDERRAHR